MLFYIYKLFYVHVYARTGTCEGVNTGGLKFILKLLNVMVASFWAEGRGGSEYTGVCGGDSSALCSNDESSHISEGTNCYATEPSC